MDKYGKRLFLQTRMQVKTVCGLGFIFKHDFAKPAL